MAATAPEQAPEKPPLWQVGAGCIVSILILVTIAAGVLFLIQTCQEWGDRAEACKQDAQCWGEKHIVYAESACKPLIEGYARYSYEWTDGIGQSNFDSWHMTVDTDHEIFYYGSKVRFQNGLGAWQRMRYICHYRPGEEIHNGIAVNVVVEPYGG